MHVGMHDAPGQNFQWKVLLHALLKSFSVVRGKNPRRPGLDPWVGGLRVVTRATDVGHRVGVSS